MTKTEMNKCKYCNSENLILEPQVKGQDVMTANVVALKCGDCGKWIKWVTKEEANRIYFRFNTKPVSELPNELIINGIVYIKK